MNLTSCAVVTALTVDIYQSLINWSQILNHWFKTAKLNQSLGFLKALTLRRRKLVLVMKRTE